MSNSLQSMSNPWTTAHQASLSITNSWGLHKLKSIESVMLSNHLILCHPLLLLPSIFPSISGSFQMSQLFASGGKVLEFQLQHQSFQSIFNTHFLKDWLVGSPGSSRNSQGSSSTLQFKNINFSVLNFLYSPTLTTIHEYWKNHSLD